MSYKLGSLFDGSGGFPLAGTLCNIEPMWAAEVEPYSEIVEIARDYINAVGGFEKFAEWGLV